MPGARRQRTGFFLVKAVGVLLSRSLPARTRASSSLPWVQGVVGTEGAESQGLAVQVLPCPCLHLSVRCYPGQEWEQCSIVTLNLK